MGEGQEEVVSLSILDTYKVRWDRWTVVRDVMQNFFDEVEAFEQIKIEVDRRAKRVRVEGPVSFALDYIRYVGATSKGAEAGRRTAGGFGEGFKVCALVLLRDYGVRLKAGSKGWSMEARLTPRTYGDGRLLGRELEYVLGEGSQQEGSYVELEGVDARMMKLFEGSSALFHHKTNPRLGRPIWVDWERGVGLYHAANARRGEVYYRRQQRGWLTFKHGSGLSVAYDGRIEALEGDRDRRKLKSPLRVLEAVLEQAPEEVLEGLFWQMRRSWSGGGGVMRTLVRVASERGVRVAFPARWVAGSRAYEDMPLEELAKRRGWRLGMPELASVGMPALRARLGRVKVLRAPLLWEQQRWEIAARLYEALSGARAPLESFRVLEMPRGDGERREGTHTAVVYREELEASFEVGVCALMVAMSQQSGAKRSSNADRITALLDGALGRHEEIARCRRRWDAVAVGGEAAAGVVELDVEEAPQPGVVEVVILGPAGWWACERLGEQVREVCGRAGVPFVLRHVAVQDRAGALVERARGVPTVWIGGQEVGQAGGATLGYRVRQYERCGEAPYLPAEALLEEALLREVTQQAPARRRGRRRRSADRIYQGTTALYRLRGAAKRAVRAAKEAIRGADELSAERYREGFEVARRLCKERARVGSERWVALDYALSGELGRFAAARGEEEARALRDRLVGEVFVEVEARLEAWHGAQEWSRRALRDELVRQIAACEPGWEERLERALERAEQAREVMMRANALEGVRYGAAMLSRLDDVLREHWEGEEELGAALEGAWSVMERALRRYEGMSERHHVAISRCLDEALGREKGWADPWASVAGEVGALGREASAEEVLAVARRAWRRHAEVERMAYHVQEHYRWGDRSW